MRKYFGALKDYVVLICSFLTPRSLASLLSKGNLLRSTRKKGQGQGYV